MVKSRRILSTVLAIVMVFTMIPMCTFGTVGAVVAEDAAINTAASTDTGDGKLVTPVVTLQATPVFRIAEKSNSTALGHVLVNATPSGQPYISVPSGNLDVTNQSYAGETPQPYTVVFTSDKALKGNPSLGCDVAGIGISDVLNNGNNTYSWTISAGTASLSAGQNIHFTVDYTYSYTDSLTGKTVEKSYKATTASHVENITNGAGIFFKYERTASFHDSSKSYYVHRLLGANTYSSYYDATKAKFDRGYFSFLSNGWIDISGDTATAGQEQLRGSDSKSKSSNGSGTVAKSTGLDGNRAVATTYVDRDGAKVSDGYGGVLTKNNLRYSMFETSDATNKKFEYYINSVRVRPGVSDWGEESTHISSAGTAIGLPEFTTRTVIGPYGEKHFQLTGDKYIDPSADLNADTGNYVSGYTIIGCGGGKNTDADFYAQCDTCVSLVINSYDKIELKALVDDLVSSDINEATTPALNSGIGINPQSNWYSAGYDAYKTALTAAQDIIATPDTTQKEIDAAREALDTAEKGLVVATANTENLELALDAYLAKNASDYLPASWNAAKAKYEAAVATKEYSVFYQSAVDKATDDLNAALAELEASGYALADWDAADELYDAYDELLADKDLFTPESWKVLEDAVAYAKQEQASEKYYVPQQKTVDEIIAAIGKAIDDLDDALADYTEYDAQVARYNNIVVPGKLAIEKSLADAGIDLAALGIDIIYTEKSWKAVQALLNLERDYTWKEQDDVNEAAWDLEDAIDGLTLVGASYTSLNNTIASARQIKKEWYTAESYAELTKALNAVNTGYKIDKQPQVNKMEADIKEAVKNLVEADANYTSYETYAGYAKDLDSKIYTEQSYNNFINALGNVTLTYKAKDQAALDAEMELVIAAYTNLEKLPADYTVVENAKATWTNFANKENYTDESIAAVTKAIGDVVYGKKIDEQEAVNAMADSINNAIGNLALKPANYAALEAAFADAKAAIKTQNDFATARNGYSYYTPVSYSAFTAVFETIPVNQDGTLKKDKKITEQATVDGWATSLAGAVSGLKLNKADYSALSAALLTVPSDQDLEDIYTTETAAAVVVAALNASSAIDADEYTVEQQNEVDALTSALTDAVGKLAEKPLDLTTYNTAVGRIPADLTVYTTESVNAMNAAKAAADEFKSKNNKISKQGDFETLVSAFDESITNLALKVVDKFEFIGTAKTATKSGVKYVYGFTERLSKNKLKNNYTHIEGNLKCDITTPGGSYVGTGSIITISDKTTGEQIDQYIVVLYGDVDGNAKIDSDDRNMIVNSLSGAGEPLTGANKFAANVSGSTSTINSQDYDLIADYVAGGGEIDQTKNLK